MKLEDTILSKVKDAKTFTSISNNNALTLYDPITQICKRIEAFFKSDDDISCRFVVNNNKSTPPKTDPETGEPITKKITVENELVDAIVDGDHFCEFRIFVKDVEKAQCLSNVIRHRHTIPEIYEAASDGSYHIRYHYLLVRVFTISAIDPDGAEGGNDPWVTDDDTSNGVTEIFGLEPMDWNADVHSGCHYRLAPTSDSTEEIPKGAPDEYEQQQWEATPEKCKWKWHWLVKSLEGNKNVITHYELNDGWSSDIWRFIECHYLPVVFAEDNLLSSRGYNSILPADLLPLIFATFNKFQISTYVRK